MFALIRLNLYKWGYEKALILFAGCLIFSISGRVSSTLSYEQHILSAVSDHYYLTYFMLPIVLLSCFSFQEDDSEIVISRFGSYHAYFYKKWLGVGIIAAILLLSQTAAILLSGLGLTLENQWFVDSHAIDTGLFSILQQHFQSPIHAYAAYSIYQLLGIWGIFGICMWIDHFIKHSWSMKILILIYLFAASWIKSSSLQALPLTGWNHLLILHHNFGTPFRFFMTGITVTILFFIITITIRFTWRNQRKTIQIRPHGIIPYYTRKLMTKKNMMILCAVVALFVLYKGIGNSYLRSGETWIYSLFNGHGTGYFQVLPFLELLVVNGTPLYLLAVFIEHAISRQSIFILVRMKNHKIILLGLLSANMKFLTLYMFLWIIGGILGACFFGYGFSTAAGKLLLYAVIVKYLDILLQSLVMLAIYIWTKQVTAGFLALLAGNLLCIIPLQWVEYLPFGLSSTTRIGLLYSEYGISPPLIICILVAFLFLLHVWLLAFGYQKLLD